MILSTNTFGLRKEWLIAVGNQVKDKLITRNILMEIGLGNRQADALMIWLRALGYVIRVNGKLIISSSFFRLLEIDPTLVDSSSWHKILLKLIEPSCGLLFIRWYLLHSATFVEKPKEVLLREFESYVYPKVFSTRTLNNAFSSLRDFMLRTPTGEELGFFKYRCSLISRDPQLPSTKVLEDYLEACFGKINDLPTSEIMEKTNLVQLYGQGIERSIANCRTGGGRNV